MNRLVHGRGTCVKLDREGVFLGMFIGPEVHVDVGEEAELTGALYARKVQIKLGATVHGAPALDVFGDLFLP